MACLNPTYIDTPETKLLRKCRFENKPFEYYWHEAHARRQLLLDPQPLVSDAYEYYHGALPSRRMSVPCGKCELCEKRKVNDYVIRNYFEYIDCITARNGSAYFITLTYADEVVPVVDVYHGTTYTMDDIRMNPELKERTTLCFDSEHIKNFLKRLRINLQRKYDYCHNIKYAIVSEFGGEYGRPHYHGLLYFDNWPRDESHLHKAIEAVTLSWTKVCDRRSRYLQLFDCQRVDVQLLDDARAITYVCKYVGKQIGAMAFDTYELDHRWKRNRWQSVGLGERIYDYCNHDLFEKGYVELNGFKYAIPEYYLTKLKREFHAYSDNGSIVYEPTDYALESTRSLFINQLTEHKKLCLVNSEINYPKVPAELYIPENVALIEHILGTYALNGFTESEYIFGTDFGEKFSELVQIWSDYNEEVRKWQSSHNAALAKRWREQKEQFYAKKTCRA